ncbi:MAG: hypothetical protein AB8B85_02690 [Paracoccaceae bacterium]
MSESNYRPSAELQGDSKSIPSKGTETGITSHGTEAHGKSLGQDSTNSMGRIRSSSKSDPMGQDKSSKDNG